MNLIGVARTQCSLNAPRQSGRKRLRLVITIGLSNHKEVLTPDPSFSCIHDPFIFVSIRRYHDSGDTVQPLHSCYSVHLGWLEWSTKYLAKCGSKSLLASFRSIVYHRQG
jgi:hypothetical protein